MRLSLLTRLRRFTGRFARADRGATAMEFGLIALPLMVMTFGLLELAMVFLVGLTLDTATEMTSREIRTGQFQTSGQTSLNNFKTLYCANMSWLQSQCAANLWLDVRTVSNFAGLSSTPPINPTTFNIATTQPCFSPGLPTDIVLVRAYFQWTLFTPLLSNALENMGGGSGKRLIYSATAFRNEPYDTTSPQGASVCP